MNQDIDRLDILCQERGYDFEAKVDIASECAWGASVTLTQHTNDLDFMRSIVFGVGGAQEPADALDDAVGEAMAWLNSGAKL